MRKITNDTSKGLVRNSNPVTQDKQYYTFALNTSLSKNITDRSTKITENKLKIDLELEETDYTILGYTWLGKNEYVYFTKNKTTLINNIWLVKNNNKILKYSNLDLSFNFSKVISSTYRTDFKGDRIIYFVDGLNKDRVINIDKVNLSDDIKSLDLLPYYDISNDIDLSVAKGGKLLQGNYVIAVSFIDNNNLESNIKTISNSVSIGDGNYFENRFVDYTSDSEYFIKNNTSFMDVTGLDNDSQTFKSLKVSLRNSINTNYSSMNVYLIRYTAETTEVNLLENFKITQEFIITGSENFIKLGNTISTVIVNNVLYNQSEAITQKDNRLIRANTKIDSFNIKFQEIANTIDVEYIVESIKGMEGSTIDNVRYERPRSIGNKGFNDYSSTILLQTSSPDYLANNNTTLNKTFSRDEVYALGVYFELEGGNLTDVFHIPGRLPDRNVGSGTVEMNYTSGEPLDTKIINFEGSNYPRWKINNTAIKTNASRGILGYYRTEEVYPEGYGFPTDGEKDSGNRSYIRHHKIPSDLLEPIISTTNVKAGSNTDFTVYRNFIGLRFNYTIPLEYINLIKKVHFTYSSKNENNKNVLGKGISYILNNNKQSDQLNRYANINNKTNGYEFYSAEGLFKFKESNISAKRLKTSSIMTGVVRYISKIFWGKYGSQIPAIPQYASYLNSEGANLVGVGDGQAVESYKYKQLVRFDNVFYNKRTNLDKSDTSLLSINTIKFTDKNSVLNTAGNTINLEGSQESIYYTLNENNQTYLKLDVDKYSSQTNGSSGSTSKLMLNYPTHLSRIWDPVAALLETQTYYDSVGFSTLLSDNPNIDSDLIHLEYEVPYFKNNLLVGDSVIEVVNGKRSYTSLMNSLDSVYAPESSNEFILTHMNGSDILPNLQENVDSLGYNDFFSFFTETQLNIRMRSYTKENDYYPHNTVNVSNLANAFEKQTNNENFYYIDEGYNKHNITTYSSNSTKLSDEIINARRLETRIVYSEIQNNESKTDNYRTSLANNYKDLITTRGGIYHLFTKQEKLYALTRDSLFLINTSNQSLKTDSNYNITVGTGEFFGIEPNEVLSIDGGIGGTSSKLSLNENPYGYLYVDRFKNKIMLFNDSLLDINTIGLQEVFKIYLEDYLPELFTEQDSPQLNYGISTGYDPILHRLFVTKKDYIPLELFFNYYKGQYDINNTYLLNDIVIFENTLYQFNGIIFESLNFTNELFENKSITVSFDPIQRTWISYHNYFPYRYINHSIEVKPVNKDIMIFDELNFADTQVLELVFNDEASLVKVFDSLELDIRSEDNLGNTTNDCFTELVAYNEKQSTGLLKLDSKNLVKKETYWNINSLRDDSIDYSIKKLFTTEWEIIKSDYYIDKIINPSSIDLNKLWYKRGRLRDKYLIVRFIRKNLDNKKIICNFVNTNVRISTR